MVNSSYLRVGKIIGRVDWNRYCILSIILARDFLLVNGYGRLSFDESYLKRVLKGSSQTQHFQGIIGTGDFCRRIIF